jgi:penicillin-binding protein 1B
MGVGGYVFVVVQELKLKIEETKISKTGITQTISDLEADKIVPRKLFVDYLLFSSEKKDDDGENKKSLDEYIESKAIEKNRGKLFINENINLPRLRDNNCQRYRCIQNRRLFSDIPASIWKGLLGTEDFRFLDHKGIDPIAIARAIVVDVMAMKFVQGVSTLTQHFVKNLFLTNERKLSRKITEVIYALYIENILEKEEIITLYLNEVFWGTYQGIYLKGFHAASLAYFNKTPKELDEFESTILVSLLKGPNYYHPSKGIKRIKIRASAVFKRLQSLNLVSKESNSIWDDTKWESWREDYIKRSKGTSFNSYYLVSKNSDISLESFEKLVLFESIRKVRKDLLPRTKKADIGIKILIANKECDNYDCKSLFSYYSKFERDKRRAMTEELHQVGSLLKPIVYESFIELGRDYNEDISTAPITLNLKSGKWSPKDYSKVKVKSIKLKVALQKSKNIPLVRVASEVGFEALEENLDKKFPRLQKPLAEFPAQLLGALELSMTEVLKTYSEFIQKKCSEIKGKNLRFEDTVLHYMSVAAETTISRLARAPLKNANVFGKTGTTNKGLDNWYFAFDGKVVYLLWFGVESKRNEHDLRLSGAVSSYLIFQNYMNNRGKQISEIICE